MDPLVSPHPAEASASAPSRGQLIDVLTDLVGDLDALDLSLEHDGVDRARRLRTSLTTQVRDHVLPRLADADTPAVVVVGGVAEKEEVREIAMQLFRWADCVV